jgi:hypothetical protein
VKEDPCDSGTLPPLPTRPRPQNVTNRQSFKSFFSSLEEFGVMVQTGAIVVIVGNKPDAFLCDHVHACQN